MVGGKEALRVVPRSVIGGIVMGWMAWRRVSALKHMDITVA